MSNPLLKFITKTATSAASSIVSGELKKHAKGFIEKYTAKSPETARREAMTRLGYETDHYVLDKNNNVTFKSSSLLMHEWLVKSPPLVGKVVKDEENGQVFFDGALITPAIKVDLLSKFAKATGISTPALGGHFDKALELLDVTDFTALKFKREFAGWDPSHSSVIDAWMKNCFGVDDPYTTKLFRKWIIGTTKRIISPGSMLDGCLTLTGPGMVGKTSFFRNLLPVPFDQRTNEIFCNPKNPQKFVENIIGKSICCFDELQVLDFVKSVETFKQILTTQYIDVRLVYRRNPVRFALRSGFCATTNKKQFIQDPFLSRRLWVIALAADNRLDFKYMLPNREHLWREALYWAGRDESHYLSVDEQKEVETANSVYLCK